MNEQLVDEHIQPPPPRKLHLLVFFHSPVFVTVASRKKQKDILTYNGFIVVPDDCVFLCKMRYSCINQIQQNLSLGIKVSAHFHMLLLVFEGSQTIT